MKLKNEIDVLIKEAQREERYFKNYFQYARKIKKTAQALLGQVKVLVFGSILKEDEAPGDIDILIISPKLKTTARKSEVRAKILKKMGISAPFEIHLITPEEYIGWYKHFIEEWVEV